VSTTINWQIVRHQVSIAGVVFDGATGQAIAGARVKIDDSPQWTLTRPDGWFFFLDLPRGNYSLTASFSSPGNRDRTISSTEISIQPGHVAPDSPHLNIKLPLPAH
jgi:hypothetical protein